MVAPSSESKILSRLPADLSPTGTQRTNINANGAAHFRHHPHCPYICTLPRIIVLQSESHPFRSNTNGPAAFLSGQPT